ncbi:MAG: hypothetical protein PVF68_08915 [Acidobacteriota bacterium]|jgi:hypothetical protein
MDVILVSCRRLPEPDADAAPLLQALGEAGIRAAIRAWDDPAVDWTATRLAVLRSAWNYPRHHREFLRWADATASVTRLWNPLSVVQWNTHKGYLLDLERRGVPVVPTVLLPAGGPASLARIRAERGWKDVVVKPAVSASSYRTRLVRAGEAEAGERHLSALAAVRDALVQPYVGSVERHGERALVWIDGELTHAVRKAPRFHGQEERVHDEAVAIAPAEAVLAARALAAIDGPLLYARIDQAPGPDGEPLLMELELVEPSLYLALSPAALSRFVTAIDRLLRQA